MNIPNSISGPAEGTAGGESLELYKLGTRNMLWLTVREGRRFILKGLPEELRSHMEEVTRLRKEYSLGLRISHSGVAGVYGFEYHPEAGPVIVMEYVDGSTLDEFLGKGRQPLKVRVAIAMQIAGALDYMHSSGLSHRDLKPDNILITRRNEAKIIDIGLGDSEDSVIYKQSVGTERFGAPEQQMPCVGDSRADVYSFGKLLELLLPEARFRKLRNGCLQEDPDKRMTMTEAVEWLERYPKDNGLIKSFFLGCILVAVVITVWIIGPWNSSRQDTMHKEASEIMDENTDVKNTDSLRVRGETIEEDAAQESFVKKDERPEAAGKPRENVMGHKNVAEDQIYEEIYNKYMSELYGEINRLGCGFDADKGIYIDSIAIQRANMASIANRMMNELSEANCPYGEITRLSNMMFDNFKLAIEKIDGRRFDD